MPPSSPGHPPLELLGERIAQHRLARDWSQAHLAALARVSPATVGRLERGMSISLEHWFAILTALELDGEVLAAIPDLYARPLKAWEAQKLRSGQRQRASSGRPQPPRPNPEWRWGDEQEEPGE